MLKRKDANLSCRTGVFVVLRSPAVSKALCTHRILLDHLRFKNYIKHNGESKASTSSQKFCSAQILRAQILLQFSPLTSIHTPRIHRVH